MEQRRADVAFLDYGNPDGKRLPVHQAMSAGPDRDVEQPRALGESLREHRQRTRPDRREHGEVVVHGWPLAGDAGQIAVNGADQRREVLRGARELDVAAEGLQGSLRMPSPEHPVLAVGFEPVRRAELHDLRRQQAAVEYALQKGQLLALVPAGEVDVDV